MNRTSMSSTGVMKEEGPMLNSYNGVVDETQQAIFESMASLDDNNLQDCFGLDIESAVAAEHAAALGRLALSNELAMHKLDPSKFISKPIQRTGMVATQQRLAHCQSPSPPTVSSAASSVHSQCTSTNNAGLEFIDESNKPKKPLSAYNLFFQLERERLISGTSNTDFTAIDVERVAIARRISDLQVDKPKRKHRKSHGVISFAGLARSIANKWKILTPHQKALLQERANLEKGRYLRELEEWTRNSRSEKKAESTESVTSLIEGKANHSVGIAEHDLESASVGSVPAPRMVSSIPDEVGISGMSSVVTGNNDWNSMLHQHQKQLMQKEHASSWGAECDESLVAHAHARVEQQDAANEVGSCGTFAETNSLFPGSKSFQFLSNKNQNRMEDNVDYASSFAASLAVSEAFRVARKTGMNPSSIMKMFEQMAVQESTDYARERNNTVMQSSLQSLQSFPKNQESFSPQIRDPVYQHFLLQQQQEQVLRAQLQLRQEHRQQQQLQLEQQVQHSIPMHRPQQRTSLTNTLHDLAEAASSDAARLSYDERLVNAHLANYTENLKRMGQR